MESLIITPGMLSTDNYSVNPLECLAISCENMACSPQSSAMIITLNNVKTIISVKTKIIHLF